MAARRFAWVLKPSPGRRKTSADSAPLPDKKGSVAIGADVVVPTLPTEFRPPKPEPSDPDEALRVAIRSALDAGDFDRVKALVAVLEASPKKAAVVDIASRRR